MGAKERFFCVKPRLVGQITGFLSLTIWLLILFATVVLLIVSEQTGRENSSKEIHPDNFPVIMFQGAARALISFLQIATIIVAIVNSIVSSLLIYACAKFSRNFVIPWLVWNSIQLFCLSTALVIINVAGFASEPRLLLLLPIYGIYVYLWLYVFLCYKTLSRPTQNEECILLNTTSRSD